MPLTVGSYHQPDPAAGPVRHGRAPLGPGTPRTQPANTTAHKHLEQSVRLALTSRRPPASTVPTGTPGDASTRAGTPSWTADCSPSPSATSSPASASAPGSRSDSLATGPPGPGDLLLPEGPRSDRHRQAGRMGPALQGAGGLPRSRRPGGEQRPARRAVGTFSASFRVAECDASRASEARDAPHRPVRRREWRRHRRLDSRLPGM